VGGPCCAPVGGPVLIVVAVAGRIGAGKSVVASRLAARFDVEPRSFGAAVRVVARASGAPLDRKSLQDLGEQLIAEEGWERFVRRVLDPPAPVVVVDGVRHVGALAALRAAGTVTLVFVDASTEVRADRVVARDGVPLQELLASDQHQNESEVDAIRRLADLVVLNDDGGDHLDQVLGEVMRFIDVRYLR
jgi:cytidylate kinase